jgi:hypothetical protein
MAGVTHLIDTTGPQARALRESGQWLVEHRQEMEQGESHWLDALARFDDDAGWVAFGQLSCVHWLRWKTKMARSTCYEKLHLAHALQHHRAVAGAYRAGRISYSAARLICRLEALEPATEETLVHLAETGTVRQLEQACEAYRQLADQERPPPDPHAHRSVRIRPDLDGWVRVEITMPTLEADELAAVLDAFMAVDRRPQRDDSGEAATSARADDHGQPAREAAGPDGRKPGGTDDGTVFGPSAGRDGEAVGGEAGAAFAQADDSTPSAAGPGIAGAGTAAAGEGRAASAQADDEHGAGQDEQGAGHREPEVAAGEGRASSAHADDEHGAGQDEQAAEHREPEAAAGTGQPEDVDRWRATRGLAFTEMVRCALAHVDGGRAAGDDRYLVHVVARDGQLTLVDGTPIDPATAQEICCDASVVAHTVDARGEPLSQGRKAREWSTAQRRAVLVRDGGRCRFVGCDRRVRDLHHRQPWEAGGPTDIDNAMACCRAHHSMLHHGYTVTAHPDGALSFTSPDGTHLGTTHPAQRRLAVAA